MFGHKRSFVKPQIMVSTRLGLFQELKNGIIHWRQKFFYKDIQNRIDYIDGANLIANDAIEQ